MAQRTIVVVGNGMVGHKLVELAVEQGLHTANRIIVASSNLMKVASRARADEIVVAPDERRGMALKSLITCRAAGYPVSEYSSFLEKEVCRIDIVATPNRVSANTTAA